MMPDTRHASMLAQETLKPLKRQRISLCQIFTERLDEIGFTFKGGVISIDVGAGTFADIRIAHRVFYLSPNSAQPAKYSDTLQENRKIGES